jgi:hypothetical protein
MNTPQSATMGLSSAASPSRQQLTTRIFLDDGSTVYQGVVLQSTFNVDPSCPYFLLMAGGSIPTFQNKTTTTQYNGFFRVDYVFSNGGSSVSTCTFFWGNNTSALQAMPFTLQFSTMPIFAGGIFDPIGNAGAGQWYNIADVTSDNTLNGYATRWTAQAQQVQVTTTLLFTDPSAGSGYETITGGTGTIGAGLIQQPWS